MPRYTVENNDGKRVTFEWNDPTPPTDADMEEVFAAVKTTAPAQIPGGKSLASKAAGALMERPEIPKASGAAGTIQRIWDATKETFVPTKESLSRLANPMAGRFGMGKVLEEEGLRVGQSVRAAGAKTAEDIATGPLANVNPNLAAGAGAAYSALADVSSDSLTPSAMQQSVGADMLGVLAKEGTVWARNKAAAMLEKGAQSAGRRGLGFLKSQLNKLKRTGGVERANAVASEMIKQKVITPMSTSDEMLARATDLDQRMGRKIGEVIDKIDKAGLPTKIDPLSLSQKVEMQLNMAAGKGATSAQKGAIKEVVDRILQTADESGGALSFSDVQAMKEVFQKNGHWASASDAFKAESYRRASGIVNAELRKAIGTAGREMGPVGKTILDDYLNANLTKGKTRDAMNALTDLTNKQAGNRFVNPLTATVGASAGIGQMAAGAGGPAAVVTALATGAATKFLDKYGAQLTATGLQNLSRLLNVGQVPGSVMASPTAAKAFISMLNNMAIPAVARETSRPKNQTK